MEDSDDAINASSSQMHDENHNKNAAMEVEATLRGLSLSAVNGNTEYYSWNDEPSCSLSSVEEEDIGPRVFGHKRSYDLGAVPDKSLEISYGSLPLHERAGDGKNEGVGFKPGHRRSRAVSLGRPKTIVVLPSTGSRMPGSYEEEDEELDQAAAEQWGDSDGRTSSDFFDVGQGLEEEEEVWGEEVRTM